MNLTLHHFLKEFRYLRLRWCVLLAVVLLDLGVQMEWVLPMRAAELGSVAGVTVSYDTLMRLVLWMVAWWFMLSVPPEESGNDGRGYAQTRPLSRVSYWAGRLMVWVLLVVTPLMLESAVYLWLNGRPWDEVALGMAERAWAAGSMTLWLLPLPLLLRGWERYAAIVLVVLLKESWLTSVLYVVFKELHWVYDSPQMAMECGRVVKATWLVGLLVPVVVMWHQRRPFGMLARLGVVVLLVALQHGMEASALFRNAYEKPSDPELIRRLTAGREVAIAERDRRFEQENFNGRKYILFRAHALLGGMPDEYVPFWRATSEAMMQKGKAMPAPPKGEGPRLPFQGLAYLGMHYPMAAALPGEKPDGLLSVDAQQTAQNMQISLPQPEKLEEPVSVHLGLTAEWMRVQRLGEVPLKAGARFQAPGFEIELLQVRPNEDGRGDKAYSCVTVVYRMSARCFEWRNDLMPLFPHPCILSPKNRYLWQFMVSSGSEQVRGTSLGWCHMIQQQTFHSVMTCGSGVTPKNLGEQRLVWLKPEYLGSSQHEMEMKDLKIGGYLLKRDGWPWSTPATEAGNPREAFLRQVRSLPRPAEGAGRAEIAQYVAEVYAASAVYIERVYLGKEGELKWPGNDREVCLLLAPYFVEHADVFRAALVHDNASLTQGVMHEAVLQAGIPGITRSEKTGWARYEREVPVAGKPGQVRKRVMEMLGLAPWRPDDLDVYVNAIRRHSDEPLWPLMDGKPPSTDEVLADYAKSFDRGYLGWLMRRPDVKYREEAERLTRKAYAELPRVVHLERGFEKPLQAAVALGMPEALDWMLRDVAMREDELARGAMMQYHAMFAPQDQGQPDTKTLLKFVQDARRYSAKDYRYDAEKMIWELRPERP